MTVCIRDDSTDCECAACREDELEWERDQGWHDDIEDEHDDSPLVCCLGADCLNPHLYHTAAECFDEEMARVNGRSERGWEAVSKRAQRRQRRAILEERERLLKTRTSVARVIGYVANVSLDAPSRKRMLDDLQAIGELVVLDLGHNHDRLVAVEAEIGPVLPRRDRERQLHEDIEGALELGGLRWTPTESTS